MRSAGLCFGVTLLLALAACRKGPVPVMTVPAVVVAPAPRTPEARLTKHDLCARTPDVRIADLPGVTPFVRRDEDPGGASALASPMPSATGFPANVPAGLLCNHLGGVCPTRDRGPIGDVCAVSNENLALLSSLAPSRHAAAVAGTQATSPVVTPKYLDRIDAHFHLTDEEKAVLSKNGFVVLDRLPYRDYANAFHDVFQEELPLFVGVDPILHAVYRGTEVALERIERAQLVPALKSLLAKLQRELVRSRSRYDAETLADLDVYVGAAVDAFDRDRHGNATVLAHESELDALLTERRDPSLVKVSAFGRSRMFDASQEVPRGHYAASGFGAEPDLEGYFRSMMWLTRWDWNLVTRSCRSSADPDDAAMKEETPREVRDALALAELVERSGSDMELAKFERVYGAFGGAREDVSPRELRRLARDHHIAANDLHAPEKLRAAIGARYVRHARTHFTPEGCPDFPVISTLFGPRIVPDIAPLTRLVNDRVAGRLRLSAGDVGYVLGHDRSTLYLGDLDSYPELPAALEAARVELQAHAAASTDLYGSWLRAVLSLGRRADGVVPSFMRTDAYADFRLDSALVSYGQLRHTFVLLAGQGYDAYGCEIPDAYVEPVPEVFDALVAHVRKLRTLAKGWDGLLRVLIRLRDLARTEASGLALSSAETRWLGMVSENIPVGGYGADSGEAPKWTGWYFDMFDDRAHGASKPAAFVADYFTLTGAHEVAYLGADGPRLGVFMVDVDGRPRAMVGPVAKGYEMHAPLASRLTDESALAPNPKKVSPWRASFAVPPSPDPSVGLDVLVEYCAPEVPEPASRPVASSVAPTDQPTGAAGEWRVAMRSVTPLGDVSITLLDHHGDPISREAHLAVGPSYRVAVVGVPAEVNVAKYGVEAMHLRIANVAQVGAGLGSWDFTTSPSIFVGPEPGDETAAKLPARPRGVASVSVGDPPAADAGEP